MLFTNLELIDRQRYHPLVLLPSAGPIEPRLNRLGIRYQIWGELGEPERPLAYIGGVLRALRFFRRNRVDLLHINHAGYWRPSEIIAAKLARIPVITHYHRIVKEPGPFVKYSRLIVAVSEYAAKHSRPDWVRKAVIYNSVDVQRFDNANDVRGELGLSHEDVVVSFIGQIRTMKGIDLFIKMAHGINGERVKFLIVGECRDPQKYAGSYSEPQLRAEIGDDKRIKYVGYRSDVENIYRSSDLIVMPSRWDEPFGLINIEAGAARKPIIASRDGGIPEIVSHGENGFLVEREDLRGLIHHVKLLIDDGDLRRQMGERGRAIVERRFTHLPIRKLEEAYASLIG